VTIRVSQVTVPASQSSDDEVRCALAQKLGIDLDQIVGLRVLKKSLDARRKGRLVFHYQVNADVLDEAKVLSLNHACAELAPTDRVADPLSEIDWNRRTLRTRPVIVGSGPAGIFAALVLVKAGQRPLIVERGEPVENRLRTVNKLRRNGEFSGESNYCYGEGGAGTFSDGKLTCGRNHPLIRFLFEQWVEFGAPGDILYEAHPHIGTDFLMQVAKNMRTYLEENGATFLFGRRLVDMQRSTSARIQLGLDDGTKLDTDNAVLAIGHSARETYEMLLERGLKIEPKPFAVGARFEHPQHLINAIQYGGTSCHIPAEYKLVAQAGERGIWTFCMCPGGHLLPTGAQPGHLAINGMSYHARNSGFANAAIVVNVRREDFYKGHPLDGVTFQQELEKKAYAAGGGKYFAPAQRLADFIAGRESRGELKSTYKPGVNAARLDRILPDFIVTHLKTALSSYNERMRGFVSDDAIVAGIESKTSAPIVMVRDALLQSVSHPGLLPTGEGAGFAGGIVSAALDGVKVGRAIISELAADSRLAL
jgi:uncharacterized FAD-dependent dehydrogenase